MIVGGDRGALIVNLADPRQASVPLSDHQNVVVSAAFDPTGTLAATACIDRRVRICDVAPSKAAVNQLAASPVAGVFLQQVSPRGWFHNTFHPNEQGHEIRSMTPNG